MATIGADLSGNQAGVVVGGISIGNSAVLNLKGSTLSGNSSGNGGGVHAEDKQKWKAIVHLLDYLVDEGIPEAHRLRDSLPRSVR